MFLILILANYLFASCPAPLRNNKNRSNAYADGRFEAAVDAVFISEKGDDSKQNCGSEADPCKTIAKGIELLGEGPGDKSVKIVDSAEIPYGFQFLKDFNLVIAAASKQGADKTLDFKLDGIVAKGKFHMVNEKTLTLEHLTFNLIPFKTEQPSKEAIEASAMILSRGVDGDLTIMDCGIYFQKWTDEYALFSILRITEGRVSIDGFYWGCSSFYYLSSVVILHISEGVSVQKLKNLQIDNAKLSKACALELPSSFTLKDGHFGSVERAKAGPALLEAKSGEDKKVTIAISNCVISSVKSLKSSNGGCLYFEMLHLEDVLDILNTKVSFARASRGGGVMIGAMNGKVKLQNMEFYECEAIEDGGGLLMFDLTQMAEFDCINVSFEECKAENGGGVEIILGEGEVKRDTILFRDCFFRKNKAKAGGNDLTIKCDGNADSIKTPFDTSSFSMTEEKRVLVMDKNGFVVIRDEWLDEDSLEVNVDAKNGIDAAECGKAGKIACRTMRQAIENCLDGGSITVYTTEECNEYDDKPITVEGKHVEISNRDQHVISIKTVLDETKVQQGEGLFNVKIGGYLQLCTAEVKVDTTRKSGQGNGLFVGDGKGAEIQIEKVNVTTTDSKQALNCVLIESKSGVLKIYHLVLEHFSSKCALILAVDSEEIVVSDTVIDSISTTSATQSVVTILSGCHSTSFSRTTFLNCFTVGHKLGGAIYLELGNCDNFSSFYGLEFVNCSCKSEQTIAGEINSKFNEESKGGAMYIRATDEASKKLKLILNGLTFTNCIADKGEYIFISLPEGRDQIDEDKFEFEMKDYYGKENYLLLEERKGEEGRIVDLMIDEQKRLPYHSLNIYVGGEASSKAASCGRTEEPCDRLNTGIHHGVQNGDLTMHIVDRVYVDEPFLTDEFVTLTSASEPSFGCEHESGAISKRFSIKENNRGILRIGSNLKKGKSIAVFGMKQYLTFFKHIDIEYPDAVEGDVLDVISGRFELKMIDVVFRPWYTGLKGENILGGEGNSLPYKLINYNNGQAEIEQLLIYGRNRKTTEKNRCNSFSKMDSFVQKYEEDKPFCSWDSGLVRLSVAYDLYMNDSSFVDISEGAILSESTNLFLKNCSFVNNHPIDAGWDSFPSLHHNIRISNGGGVYVESLAPGSDGLDGKPFGMLSAIKACGNAIDNMDSYFFSPILKSVSLKKDEASRKDEAQNQNENEKEIEAIVQGSYFIPCELTFEVCKKRKGKEIICTDCPIFEHKNETEMKVRIQQSLLDVDDYTSVICRLSYSSGIINGEKMHSRNIILVKQKKADPNEDKPKETTKKPLVAIIASVSSVVVVVIVAIVIVACVLKTKKRRQYKAIDNLKL
ncbi:uncharacterized protein MONOS_10161 [Monocercomonoides exilis]|uniref:uncharacterized protein n=1 Tax=Monocercomonoides exilis TaxID=2049356 RepID=UPI00355A73C1|nr:hypothetical protein MONOS_10161 [Monocercomonoides exilis]|eukprot:MONOS_10161.1-p1 / transcript=MONOS_10161.1 / gene=MONOS_10161 / organism=Monocercomonoides_exilis_PA203 / gene_product=unspecified product / transcript_product=unspecified product / location=Mono_scaffold00450:19507-23553(+) / protein_length=1349 / sequence_SO=supercontig / SO=protein_coding / is_pseudo=false